MENYNKNRSNRHGDDFSSSGRNNSRNLQNENAWRGNDEDNRRGNMRYNRDLTRSKNDELHNQHYRDYDKHMNDYPGSNDFVNGYNTRYKNEGWKDNYRNDERGWWDKTKDEVASWFGDDDADHRHHRDEKRMGQHRGKGPKNYTRSEERIKEDVSDILCEDSFLDASDIEVDVEGSEVTLNGHVDSRYSKHRSEDLAEDITGVTNVQNNLRVLEHHLTETTLNKSAIQNEDIPVYNQTKNRKENSNL